MKNFPSILLLLCLSLLPTITYSSEPEQTRTLAAWTQYVTDGVEARVVTTGACPNIKFDQQSTRMIQRAAPTKEHPNRVCSTPVPAGTTRIQLGETILPVPVTTTPERIVVIGDTGCRVSAKHGLYQACNNSSLWPFKQVADSAAQFEPELIIYTGDYIYRESPCPTGNNGCKDTPWGDNQATWIADWFQSSDKLRAAAVFVFVRGNHENCARAGMGWFRYLDARPYTGQCQRSTEPWLMEAGSLKLVILDTSVIKDADKKPLTELFSKQLSQVKTLLTSPGWIVTHRPFWGFGADDNTGQPIEITDVLQDAVRTTGLSNNVRLLIGAHLHLAEVISFDKRPPQLIVGNSGTELIPANPIPAAIDGMPILHPHVFYQYGFVTMSTATPDDWHLNFRDVEGRIIEPCLFKNNKVVCTSQ